LRQSSFQPLDCSTQQQMSLVFAQLVMFLETLHAHAVPVRSTSVVMVALLNLNQS
jgi:hypothetical protein